MSNCQYLPCLKKSVKFLLDHLATIVKTEIYVDKLAQLGLFIVGL